MDNQKAYELIWERFIARSAPFSFVLDDKDDGEDVMVRYRGVNGLRCPIGFLLSDDDYRDDLEGQSVEIFFGDTPSLHGIEKEFLMVVQMAYDVVATDYATGWTTENQARKEFKHALKRIAKQFNVAKRKKIKVIRRST